MQKETLPQSNQAKSGSPVRWFTFGLAIFLAIISLTQIYAQSPWASAVLDHRFGTSQIVGQDSAYFPANVLGPVTKVTSTLAPAASPAEVVSLGKGGYVVLAFDPPIIDGEGTDFIVFENAFYFGGSFIFDEWLTVSVSNDGVNWTAFPTDTLTGAGFAGRVPTGTDSLSHLNPTLSGGDLYDLNDLGISEIRYVRLDDATHHQWNLSRFQGVERLSAEVDAVGAVHQKQPSGLTHEQATALMNRPFLRTENLIPFLATPVALRVCEVWTLTGQLLAHATDLSADDHLSLPQSTAAGVLLVRGEYANGLPFAFLLPWLP